MTKLTRHDQSIAPVTKSIVVNASAEKAFEAFSQDITDWWPLESHSLSMSECGEPAKSCTMEPFENGRLYEVMANGMETDWGRVLEWSPGTKLVFTWHVGVRKDQETEVEVEFESLDSNRTKVTLVHRNWHVIGEEAEIHRDGYDAGWVEVFEIPFKSFVER